MTSTLSARGGARAWFVWSLAALAFGYAFFQRVTPGVMVSDLMRDFAIGGGMLGVLSALYFYPYVILQVLLGALLDRLGARILLFAALMIAGIGSFLFGFAEGLPTAYTGRILIGVGSAVGFLGALSLAGKWFPPERFAMITGMTMFFAMMSGVLGQGPLSLFIETYGWRASQWWLGAFGIGLAITILIFVRNAPPSIDGETKPAEVQSWSSVWANLWKAASLWNTWKVALVAATLSGSMLVLGGLWGVPYVMRTFDLARPEAAFLVSLMLVGWAIGAPLNGWISDRLQRRKIILVCGAAVLSLAVGLLAFASFLSLFVTISLLVIAGAAGSTMVATFALVRETSTTAIGNSAIGIVNAMTVASGALLQPIVGLILDFRWDGTFVDGSRVYQSGDYRAGFIVVFATVLFGFLLSLTLKEGGNKQPK